MSFTQSEAVLPRQPFWRRLAVGMHGLALPETCRADGEVLYNGIRLPSPWPPRLEPAAIFVPLLPHFDQIAYLNPVHLRLSAPATRTAPNPTADPVTPQDVAATIYHCLDIDPETRLPSAALSRSAAAVKSFGRSLLDRSPTLGSDLLV
jgi:hypothetical protein